MSNILKISEAASIGLHSMIMLAENPDKLLSVKDIAKEFDISANHLSKVLQRLVKAELVISIKGAKGGFRLAKKPDEIAFIEIYEAIDGKFNPSDCLLNKNVCQKGTCIMHGLVASVNKQVKEYFQDTKLSSFVKKK